MIRRAFRQTHRGGSQDFATVEWVGGKLVTVRLATSSQRLSNLRSTNPVTVGEQVIVDYSMGTPYVRPVTIAEDEVVFSSPAPSIEPVEQQDTGVCWRVEDSTTYTILGNQGDPNTIPVSYLIPDFDQVIWGEESLVVPCPFLTGTVNANAQGKNTILAPKTGKWVGSFRYRIRASDDWGNGFPNARNEIYSEIYVSHKDTYFTKYWNRRCYHSTVFIDENDTKNFTCGGVVLTQEPTTYVYPRIYVYRPRAYSPPYYPYQHDYYDYEISDISFDFMLIAYLSDKDRSTEASHWDDWYEKYPDQY